MRDSRQNPVPPASADALPLLWLKQGDFAQLRRACTNPSLDQQQRQLAAKALKYDKFAVIAGILAFVVWLLLWWWVGLLG